MESKIEKLAESLAKYKKGYKIHIKKANRGKFTDYCGGKVTSECIARGKNSPNPAIRKRATFAANARKWKHAEGGTIEPESIFTDLKTVKNKYNPTYLSYINDNLREKGWSKAKRAAVLANIIPESGANPYAKNSDGFYGLMQWTSGRYAPTEEKNVYAELDNQTQYLFDTGDNATDRVSWTKGISGSGYKSNKEAIADFNSDDVEKATWAYTLGYVRPGNGLKVAKDRTEIAKEIYNLPGFYQKGGNLVYAPFGTESANNEKSLAYKPFLRPEEQTSDLEDFIYSNYKPNFPVVPVQTTVAQNKPVESKPVETKSEFNLESTTPTTSIAITNNDTPMETTVTEPIKEVPKTSTNIKYSKTEQAKFTKDLYNLYYKELTKRGIQNAAEYAEWLTAQDALETRWGASTIGTNNFGNIQYFDKIHGNKYSYTGGTDKHKDGTKYSARFVNFDNIEDYIAYKIGMLSNKNSKRYRDIFIGDVNGFADRMQASGYAESKSYGEALKKVRASVKKYLNI